MRPVNLIPPEDRRGDRAPLRAGSLSYIVVGSFAAILVAVLALVMTQNSITDRENEVAELEAARDTAAQQAQALAPYAEFASLQAQRDMTITSLAASRFDWERVMRELALVIPPTVTLNNLEAATAGDGESSSSNAPAAPTLRMSGCATSHESVAAFVAALEDIDGITRVGLENSTEAGDEEGGGAAPSAGAAPAGEDAGAACAAGKDAATFSLQAVFDGVAVDPATAAPAAPAPPAATAPAETNSAGEQTNEAQSAANLASGGS